MVAFLGLFACIGLVSGLGLFACLDLVSCLGLVSWLLDFSIWLCGLGIVPVSRYRVTLIILKQFIF